MIKKSFLVVTLALAGLSMSAEAPSGYYDSCEGKNSADLLTALYNVVNSHTVVSYDNLYTVYKTSDVDADGKIWDIYSTKRWSTSEKCGSYKVIGDCFNREHSFPKSWFNDAKPMYSDAFHIYPTDGKVNGQRSNYPYGECSGGSSVASSGGIDALGKLGTSTFSGYTGKVFEPDDEYKGDLARTYFYMAAAYNGSIASWSSDMLAKNSYPAFSSWAIDLLLKWHRQDPVSEKEINRNEAIYSYQKNRNPFIDHPELAEYIWGNKTSSQWYANGVADPDLAQPVDGSTVDFGTTATNYSISRSVAVRGTALTEPVKISVNNSAFTLSTTSIPAATANGESGAVSVTFRGASAGTYTAVLTLTCGDLTSRVNLTATAIDGIPALAATQIDESSFMANWMDLDDENYYSLNVMQDGRSLSGFPVSVLAAEGEYRVSGLQPSTTYTYQLSSSTLTSNIVSVTTSALIPSIEVSTSSDLSFRVDPQTASEAAEIWLDVENIDSQMVVEVDSPFEVSTDLTNWAQSITLSADEDRFYLRVGATKTGEYSTFVVITAGDYVNDNTYAEAVVADTSTPWFVETFEFGDTKPSEGYLTNTEITGSAAKWIVNNVGFYKSDYAHGGTYCARLGKTNGSSITLSEAKKSGIGVISFYGKAWSSSETAKISVDYSSDGGETWITAGTVDMSATTYTEYTVTVNVGGNNLLRLAQTEGGRGYIDDITVSDYATSAVDDIYSEDTWDAYSLDGALVIANHGATAQFLVYDLKGITVVDTPIAHATRSYRLPAGLYIVTDNQTARRVVVK